MKRLIRKAWDSVELYHFTSSQLFMKIMNDGQITSGGYNNVVSNGGHMKVYDLAGNNPENNYMKTIEFLLNAKEGVGTSNTVFSKELSDYIDQRLNENNDMNEQIEVSISNPSHNEIGVYLSNDQDDPEDYMSQSLNANSDANLPNFGITLKISVQTDALVPDYDDLDANTQFSSDNPLWRQSLDKIGQVVHNGPIDVSNITSVKITTNTGAYEVGKPFERNRSEILNWFDTKLSLNQWISADEAVNQLNQMNQEYQNLTLETLNNF